MNNELVMEAVRNLLRLQVEQAVWLDKLESTQLIELREPIAGGYLLVHVALDLLGVAAEIRDGVEVIDYCRDWHVDKFNTMVMDAGNIDGFIAEMLKAKDGPPLPDIQLN